jgi:hypothetical protein
MTDIFWRSMFCLLGLLVGLALAERRNKPASYVDDKTSEDVREALFRAGFVKSEVSNAMVEMRKSGIVFFKQVS